MYPVQAWLVVRFQGVFVVFLLVLAGCLDPTVPTGPTETPGPTYGPVEPLGWAWREAAAAPDPVAGAACTAFDRGLWLFGGRNENGLLVPDVNVYDPATDAWRPDTSLPERRSSASALVVGGTPQYLGGFEDSEGLAATESVLQYHSLGFYIRGTDLPRPTAQATAASLGGMPILVGGTEGSGIPSASVLTWTPPFGWQTGGRLGEPRIGAGVLPLNATHFIVAGGTGPDGPSSSAYTQDLSGSRLADLPDVPTPRSGAAVANSKVRIFLLGGVDATGAVRASAEFYDAYAGAWYTVKGLPVPVRDACAVAMEDGVHVIGGEDADGVVRSDHWVLAPELEVGDQE